MRNFLLALFVLLSPYLFALSEAWKNLCASIKTSIKNFKNRLIRSIKNFFISIWKTLKWIGRVTLKLLWVYPILAFIFCMIISEKYPQLPWADYVWVVFFFVMMTALFIFTITEDNDGNRKKKSL